MMTAPANYYRLELVKTTGYGHRIWLPTGIDRALHAAMDSLSMWGATDKQENGWISWEVHDIQLLRALSELQHRGFVELKPDPHSVVALDLLGDRYGDPGIW